MNYADEGFGYVLRNERIPHCRRVDRRGFPPPSQPIALYTKRKENISVMTQEQSTPMKSLILTFLSAVSRASPSALPEQEGLSTIHGELSSLSFPEYLKRNTLHISSLKMYPRSARFAKGAFLPRSSVSYLDWGICANGNVLTARLTFPKQESACSLSDILIPDVPEKYYLSREKAEKLFPNSQIISLRESESTTQAEQP